MKIYNSWHEIYTTNKILYLNVHSTSIRRAVFFPEQLTSISSPILYFSITSRASLECPTSSNSSVASLPACSNKTSSPPGCCKKTTKGRPTLLTSNNQRTWRNNRSHVSGSWHGHTSFRNSVTSYMLSLITIHGVFALAFSWTSINEYFFTCSPLIAIRFFLRRYDYEDNDDDDTALRPS